MFVNFQNQTYPGGGMTTQAFGEEGGGSFPPGGGMTTMMAGGSEEGGGGMTTQAFGEEGGGYFPPGGGMTTMMAGGSEEGGGFPTPAGDEKTTLGNLARNFNSLDQNHDGFLQAQELMQAGNDPTVQTILNNAYVISMEYAEGHGSSMQGISQEDLIVAATRVADGTSLAQQIAKANQLMGAQQSGSYYPSQTGAQQSGSYYQSQTGAQNPMQGMMQMMMQMLQMMMMGRMGGQVSEPPPPPPPPANDFGGMMDPETMMLFMQVMTKLLELVDTPTTAKA